MPVFERQVLVKIIPTRASEIKIKPNGIASWETAISRGNRTCSPCLARVCDTDDFPSPWSDFRRDGPVDVLIQCVLNIEVGELLLHLIAFLQSSYLLSHIQYGLSHIGTKLQQLRHCFDCLGSSPFCTPFKNHPSYWCTLSCSYKLTPI